jgi:hypothetical protein
MIISKFVFGKINTYNIDNMMIDILISKNMVDKSTENELIQLKNNPLDYSQLRRD